MASLYIANQIQLLIEGAYRKSLRLAGQISPFAKRS